MLAQSDATLIGLLEEALGALPAGAGGTRAQVMAPFVVPGSHRWEVFRVQEG